MHIANHPKPRNIPLLAIATISCTSGLVGCFYLWKRHRKNYIWVINKIFLPTLLHSFAGLLSTIVNIYGIQDGTYDVLKR